MLPVMAIYTRLFNVPSFSSDTVAANEVNVFRGWVSYQAKVQIKAFHTGSRLFSEQSASFSFISLSVRLV